MGPLTPAGADRAIYVDFEGLGTATAAPSLLGVLFSGSDGMTFRQFILDPRLERARVARKDVCVVQGIDEAATFVMDLAERGDRHVVSWSTFELEQVRSRCTPVIAGRFERVYSNALMTARPWKRNLYPTFTFETDRFGGHHPLKEYFRMIGCELPAHLRPPTPAKWLRHTIDQIQKHEGRYRAVTTQAKRDWHRLLEYNEHDCRGMREVVQQAAKELALWTAYSLTNFVVFDGTREIRIHVGTRNPKLDLLLNRLGVTRWALLTASNPESVPRSRSENEMKSAQLMAQLRAAGYSPLPAEGRDPEGKWPAEASALVPNMTKKEARLFGRMFDQLAIVTGHAASPATLVASGLAPDRHRK